MLIILVLVLAKINLVFLICRNVRLYESVKYLALRVSWLHVFCHLVPKFLTLLSGTGDISGFPYLEFTEALFKVIGFLQGVFCVLGVSQILCLLV